MSAGNNPFEMMERMIDQMRSQFDQASRAWETDVGGFGAGPMGIDLADQGDAFVVTADLPGFTADEVDLRITDRTLQIRATHEESTEQSDEGAQATYLRSERSHRALQEQVQMPESVRVDDIEATLQNGVLTVTIPKAEPTQSGGRQIDIE